MRASKISVAFYTRSEPQTGEAIDDANPPAYDSPARPGAISVPLGALNDIPGDLQETLRQLDVPGRRELQQFMAAHDNDED